MTFTMALEPNLATLACRAASEIDNLLLNRLLDFKAVPLLVDTLKQIDQSGKTLLDPGDAVVMNRAIANAGMSAIALRTTAQLVEQADSIRNQLEGVVSDPNKSNAEDLKRLRAFCVELSKSAANYTRSLEEVESQHPFRR